MNNLKKFYKKGALLLLTFMIVSASYLIAGKAAYVSANAGDGSPGMEKYYITTFVGCKVDNFVYYADIKSLKSSNKKVATVSRGKNNHFTVKAKKKGSATIYVTTKKGKKMKCKVTVRSNKLEKKDFQIVDGFTNIKTMFIDRNSNEYDIAFQNENNDSGIETIRGVSLRNDKNEVLNRYKATVLKYDPASDRLYQFYLKGHKDADGQNPSETAKLMKDTFKEYFEINYDGTYRIRIYFDECEFVSGIAYIKNYDKLPA